MTDEKELRDAWDRIARSADGHAIYLYLQKRLMAVRVSADDGTLREDNGQRLFASELLGLMAKGIEESATGLASRLVTISRTGPVAVARARGAGRRINADTPVAGYDAEPNTDASASGNA